MSLSPEKPLFFLHIPKTGGSSLRKLLTNRFSTARSLLHVHRSQFSQIDPNPYEYVSGEVSVDYLERYAHRPETLVCLRDPIERGWSSFHYYSRRGADFYRSTQDQYTPQEWDHKTRLARLAQGLSLAEFVDREPEYAQERLGNLQTRVLSGPSQRGPHALDQALRFLDHCEFIALTEELPRSIDWLCRQRGWHPPAEIPRENVNEHRPPRDAMPAADYESLHALTRDDQTLYRHAQRCLQQRLSSHAARPPVVAVSRLASDGVFRFDQPIHGQGWHERECWGDGWMCWTGPATEARLRIAAPAEGVYQLCCQIVHAASPETLTSLQIWLNEQAVPLHWVAADVGVTVQSAAPLRIDPRDTAIVELRLAVNQTLRLSSTDARSLGVGLRSISLKPIERLAAA